MEESSDTSHLFSLKNVNYIYLSIFVILILLLIWQMFVNKTPFINDEYVVNKTPFINDEYGENKYLIEANKGLLRGVIYGILSAGSAVTAIHNGAINGVVGPLLLYYWSE